MRRYCKNCGNKIKKSKRNDIWLEKNAPIKQTDWLCYGTDGKARGTHVPEDEFLSIARQAANARP